MEEKMLDISFRYDSRAVSEVVGFIMIFAIIIIFMSINQAQLVPMENGEIEFQHFEDVRNDMIEVRSGIMTAGQADVSQFPTVKLGTQYPPRLFAINPPPPSGTLQTSPEYNIQIDSGDPKNVSTRFLVYRNGYNEMNSGQIWYEHSVYYLDARENGGGIAVYEDQNIITGNDTARVTALQNDFSVSSTGRVTLELYPTERASINSSDLDGNVTIKIPSRLNDTMYWGEAIDTTESDMLWYHGTEDYPGESKIYWVNLTVKAEALQINTVGIQKEPTAQESITAGVGIDSLRRGKDEKCAIGDNRNPGAFQFNKFEKFKSTPGQDKWTVDLQVQDADNDDDLSQVKFEVTDSSGTERGSDSVSIPDDQYDPGTVDIPANAGYDVSGSKSYSLTVTVCDSDGNSQSKSLFEV